MQITRSTSATAKGPANWSTGDDDDAVVHWLTPVTDEEYGTAPTGS